MAPDDMRKDVQFLAGQLRHRGALTEHEREAAEYIFERMKEVTPHAQMEEFHSPERVPGMLALYHFEFLITALLAVWSPLVAAFYGLLVFVSYLAEITGYSAFSRFLPQFETQNVVGRINATARERTLVVMANYDTQRASVLGGLSASGRVRWVQVSIVIAMLVVVATCGYQALAERTDVFMAITTIRWASVAFLLISALAFYTSVRHGGHTPGANNNASGVAVLLEVERRLARYPLTTSEVWFVATGAKETGFGGARRALQGMEPFRETTYFLNITGVGAGALGYTRGEGVLYVFPSDEQWLAVADREASSVGARPVVYTGPPTDSLIPLTRGYPTMTVMGLGEGGCPENLYRESDRVADVEDESLLRAADFVERLVRGLDTQAVGIQEVQEATAEE